MFLFKPTHFYLCSGASEGYTPLNAFDCCLLEAGVGNANLIQMSSILPPGVVRIDPMAPEPGSFVPLAYASINSVTPLEIIAAAVAGAIPKDKSLPGVIMEYSARGHAKDVERIARSMAEEAMKHRGYEIDEILSISTEHEVEVVGSAFAAVVLCELEH
jgi:arginine decarboxylase